MFWTKTFYHFYQHHLILLIAQKILSWGEKKYLYSSVGFIPAFLWVRHGPWPKCSNVFSHFYFCYLKIWSDKTNKQKQKTNSLNLAKYFKLRKWVHVGLELWQKGKKKFNTKPPSCQVGECRESVDETIALNIRYVWILNSFIN